MHCVKSVTNDILWIGASDRRISLFENVYPVPRGVSYNSYLLLDDSPTLLDTVDRAVAEQFLENLEHALNGKTLEYLIVNHMEPDHCSMIPELIRRYPDVHIVCNAKALKMIQQFFDFDLEERVQLVKEGDTLDTGHHTLSFVMAPMVHWPEVMVTYDTTEKVLFSADAFGTFNALDGNLFADELDFEKDYLCEARRYYTNIVGKYGQQVQTLLKKASSLNIQVLCPLHGPVWRKDISWFFEKYRQWSAYEPEEKSVMIAYASVYGHTENAASILASFLADRGIRNIRMYDVSVTHPSYTVSECFRCSHLVFASTTYNAGIFVNMENTLHDIAAHNLQNRTIALIENGSWAPTSGGLMRDILGKLKNVTLLDESITLRSALKADQLASLNSLADALSASMNPHADSNVADSTSAVVDPTAMFKLSYGLFVLIAKSDKDNGCIINTVTQITDTPKRISIAVNKANYTHDMIVKTGLFNLSVLSIETPFSVFERFGFQSGKSTDKFEGFPHTVLSRNGLLAIDQYCNAFISCKVFHTIDCGTHTVFFADVTEAKTISQVPSLTYSYYFEHVKPKPPVLSEQKGWVCKICGYIYEGEVLPEDYICPLCKHGAEDFERL